MSPLGNGKSASAQGEDEPQDHDSYHSSRSAEKDDSSSHPSNPSSPRDIENEAKSSDEDDETSDPVFVSPTSSPPSSPESCESSCEPPSEKSENDIFEDAKVTPESISLKTPSFVTAGLQRKSTPLAIKSWAALALTLDGRDKITKVFQYASRFLGWWLAGGPHKNKSLRFMALYKSLSTSRKAFRLGRSLIEFDKLRSMGLLGLIFWHLQRTLEETAGDKPKPTTLFRRVSSNIGWGPTTLTDEKESRPSSARSLSSAAYRKMYRPLLSRMSSTFASTETPSTELWKGLGSAIKMFGLLGFWTGDNVNFLCSSGVLDDFSLPNQKRIEKRKRWQTLASVRANQAYFGGCVTGLLLNWYIYLVFRRDKLVRAEERVREAVEHSLDDQEKTVQQLTRVKEKQFSLSLALLKSCCDVIVFSNNAGIDLHQKWRGKKNHEGLHCLCGLISAGTVIYNNFPDVK